MNYVGQLAETVYVTVKELYESLNAATLSGGIDVLVVKQPDGSFLCSPFHVRFGKLGVLRSREKVVDIEINGEPVDLQMKLGDDGEAFFAQERETTEEEDPTSLFASSIPSEEILSDPLLDLIEDAHQKTSEIAVPLKKKRWRRKKAKKKDKIVEAITPNSSSDEPDGVQSEISLQVKPVIEFSSTSTDDKVSAQSKDSCLYLDVPYQERDSFCTADDVLSESKDSFFLSDVECPWKECCSGSFSSEYLTSFKSDSEMDMRSTNQDFMRTGSHIQWPWGRFPQVRTQGETKGENAKLLRASHSNVATKPLLWEEPISQKASFHKLAESQTVVQDAEDISGSPYLIQPPAFSQNCRSSDEAKCCFAARNLPAAQDSLAQDHEENVTKNTQEMGSSSGSVMSAKEPKLQEGSDPSGQRTKNEETQRSQHLGPSGIYLEDSPSLNSTNATLYFPQSEIGLEAKRLSEPSCSETNLLHAAVVEDTNTANLSDTSLEQENDIKLSLCGGLADNRDISTEKFTKYAISYQNFADNPGILNDPNLVVKIGNKHYNWAVAAPMILSLQAFQKSLPKSMIDKLVKEKMPRKSGRWWFSWGLKDATTEEHEVQEVASTSKKTSIQQEEKMDSLSVEDCSLSSLVVLNAPPKSRISSFKKSLRLSSDQIRDLNLREGANDVVFSVTTQYQGTCRCHANIYLWNWYDKVVISDIDGTITKSDALGHILPQLGKNWTHQGIIKLYHKIHVNGYKFLYCSARSIGMADLTRGYLQWVNEHGYVLPKGPLLLTPSGLFSALHREVVEKKPEVFKIACLTDIHHLFLPHGDPFFAGFGNRDSDVYAYLHVGIPKSRIFTVNPQGELIQELIKNHKTTYDQLGETVELIFPPVKMGPSVKLVNPEYSQFCYWRIPFLTLSLKDLTSMD
ncbi:phosphatidate phosphatase LPIN3 [Petaurus breviceps papuanus]|uniref:phosphatidate phosphatase LPIN3 n=1 Tax=Petaurus breviceps papuanus TaxID=3040969 RepID=UPI0036DE3B30